MLILAILHGTEGHSGTWVKSPNAQGEFDLWQLSGDAQLLSYLDELRIPHHNL